jgi:hypothetical protein
VWCTVGRVFSLVTNTEILRNPTGLTGHAKREISKINEIPIVVNGKTGSGRKTC